MTKAEIIEKLKLIDTTKMDAKQTEAYEDFKKNVEKFGEDAYTDSYTNNKNQVPAISERAPDLFAELEKQGLMKTDKPEPKEAKQPAKKSPTKADYEKAIKGLEILAKRTNDEKYTKAIKGLKILAKRAK